MMSTLTRYAGALASAVRRHPADAPLPTVSLQQPGVTIDPERLAAYAHVCRYTVSNTVPPTYPNVLAFGLALDVMTRPDFPLPVIGSVHVAEEITVIQAPRVDDVLDLAVRPENLRPHRRGRQFDLVTTASVEGAEVWRSRSTYLRRQEGPQPAGAPSADTPQEPATASPDVASEARPEVESNREPGVAPQAQWRLPGDLGRRYAAVSGDRNPIHLYPLTARLFGFRRPIAHGMWTLAATLAAVQNRLGERYQVRARFARPVLLPGTVHLSTTMTDAADDRQIELILSDPRGREHLTVDVRS